MCGHEELPAMHHKLMWMTSSLRDYMRKWFGATVQDPSFNKSTTLDPHCHHLKKGSCWGRGSYPNIHWIVLNTAGVWSWLHWGSALHFFFLGGGGSKILIYVFSDQVGNKACGTCCNQRSEWNTLPITQIMTKTQSSIHIDIMENPLTTVYLLVKHFLQYHFYETLWAQSI